MLTLLLCLVCIGDALDTQISREFACSQVACSDASSSNRGDALAALLLSGTAPTGQSRYATREHIGIGATPVALRRESVISRRAIPAFAVFAAVSLSALRPGAASAAGTAMTQEEATAYFRKKRDAANAKNEARKARCKQCEEERKVLKTKKIEETDIMPATEDPSQPASCVGYNLYRSSDPKLPVIYYGLSSSGPLDAEYLK